MTAEPAALAAAGATTLVSLMVTDAWAQARQLVGRLVARGSSDGAPVAELDAGRATLLAADARDRARATREITAQWHIRLHELLRTGAVTGNDLGELLASLQRITDTAGPGPVTVHNSITGGVHEGPVIQSGHITGLTLHIRDPAASVPDSGLRTSPEPPS
ncbi:hypothetical protein EDD93_5998 [Streptomyces sp. 840.1]|uniref:hypothetical protein n=1 Tax=Streptomyces sp. 840.1 TaxID=2485152 RepID=UPI000FBD69C0|nr:hypothetical protein [Streptomyces sp. 840.1]ROQ63255.1 hypothetical protein EDD93_5998 [Streptomyces sp. 840.1]